MDQCYLISVIIPALIIFSTLIVISFVISIPLEWLNKMVKSNLPNLGVNEALHIVKVRILRMNNVEELYL